MDLLEDIMPLSPLYDKWKSFCWHVQEIDGHNMQTIINAVHEAQAILKKTIGYFGAYILFLERCLVYGT